MAQNTNNQAQPGSPMMGMQYGYPQGAAPYAMPAFAAQPQQQGPPQQNIPATATVIQPQYFYYPHPVPAHEYPMQQPQQFQPQAAAGGDEHVVPLDAVGGVAAPAQPSAIETRVVYVGGEDEYADDDARSGDRLALFSWLLFVLGWFLPCMWFAGIYFVRARDSRARVGGYMSLGASLLWLLFFIYTIKQGMNMQYPGAPSMMHPANSSDGSEGNY